MSEENKNEDWAGCLGCCILLAFVAVMGTTMVALLYLAWRGLCGASGGVVKFYQGLEDPMERGLFYIAVAIVVSVVLFLLTRGKSGKS